MKVWYANKACKNITNPREFYYANGPMTVNKYSISKSLIYVLTYYSLYLYLYFKQFYHHFMFLYQIYTSA